jgi:ribosomal silencing factor RsfS
MGTKLPYSVEQKAVRDSMEYSDRMRAYESGKDGGDWAVLKLGAIVVGTLACFGLAVYSLLSAFL